MRRNKKKMRMISKISNNDTIITNSGIIGVIVKNGNNFIKVNVANDTIIRIQKNKSHNTKNLIEITPILKM